MLYVNYTPPKCRQFILVSCQFYNVAFLGKDLLLFFFFLLAWYSSLVLSFGIYPSVFIFDFCHIKAIRARGGPALGEKEHTHHLIPLAEGAINELTF